jgi:DNA-binding NarL/FixJ family response regulator
MSPEVARRVIELFRTVRPPERSDYHLTPHEIRLLKLLVEGHNYKTAAAELGVSVHTVSFHLRSIYDKLQVHSKTEAVAKALRHRLIS